MHTNVNTLFGKAQILWCKQTIIRPEYTCHYSEKKKKTEKMTVYVNKIQIAIIFAASDFDLILNLIHTTSLMPNSHHVGKISEVADRSRTS